ncbi:MAG: hypothetical protein WD733_23905 [Bryobacterales bacterium]
MFSIRTAFVCLGLLLANAAQLAAEDRIFLFSPGSAEINVLNAATLTSSGSIEIPPNNPIVLAPADGSKYYVVRQSPTDTVAVVDPATLAVTKTISLGTNASDAVITPDGKYLLVAAGSLRVFSTATDEEVSAPIPVGGAPTQILVNNPSTRAYILANSGHSIQLIDLVNLTRSHAIGTSIVGTVSTMALTEDDSRLVAVSSDGLKQFRSTDLKLLNVTPFGSFNIVRGRLALVPGSQFAFVENGGSPPSVTSLLVGLDNRQVRHLGEISNTNLDQITPLDGTSAYAVESGVGLVKIVFTNPALPTIETVLPGFTAATLTLSPNRRFLYASSPGNSRVTRLEIETNTITHGVTVTAPPASHGMLFDPVSGPPARLVVNGGDNQSIGPDKDLPVELSVKALSSDGSPMAGQSIFFSVNGGVPLEINPTDVVVTNQRGIAAIKVRVPPLSVIDAAKSAQKASVQKVGLTDSPPVSEQATDDPILSVSITANAGGAVPVGFTVNVVRAVGLVKLSGDHQVVTRGERFPLPIVMLATDAGGNPLPAGTVVEVRAPGGIVACGGTAEVDAGGIVTAQCLATLAGNMQNSVVGGFIIADATLVAPDLDRLDGQENFSYNVGINPRLTVEKQDGDLQTAPSGSTLSKRLRFVVNNSIGIPIIAQGGIGVTLRQISGPPVILEKQFLVAGPGVSQNVGVTLGPAAGIAVIEVQASAPGLPSARFTVTATGGQPQRIEKAGDNQSGRTGSELPTPLEVRVFNESNQIMHLPQVTWTVLEGDAQLVPGNTPTSATARVLIGNTPGTIRVQARAGTLVGTFVVTATPPQPVSISTTNGQNQTLTAGVLSDPLLVVVNEANNQRASGVPVTFSGPPNIVLHALTGGASGNPLQQTTDANGQTGVRAELIASAALQSGSPSQSSTVTITAAVGDTLSTTFLLSVVGRGPAFEVSGVVNAASGQPGVVPGSLATIFGTGLSENVSGTVLVGGETSYEGTVVRIGQFQAPLISITGPPNEQINFQVPFELSAGIQTAVEVQNSGSSTTVGGVPSYASQPGIFTVAFDETTTLGAVIHSDTGALVTPDDPAGPGDVVSLFITGGGPVNPPALSGVPTQGLPPLMVLPVVVGVNHSGTEILFSGYAPGFIGLYQINFRIPLAGTCGLAPLNVRVGEVTSNLTNTSIACP